MLYSIVEVVPLSEVSKRLLAAITSKNYSYGELSRLTGIPKSAIQRYATGETEKIPMDRLELMASALDVESRHLMGWDDDSVSDRDKRLLEWFHSLPEEKQKAILIAQDAPKDLL